MKVVFVTGGVLSGIGKGITAASLGALMKSAGLKVFTQKFDGYLNVDPGTMSPFQHGEVFVTDDGAETDLDLGHYERFTDTSVTRLSSFTSGKLFEEIIAKERRGDYLGKTVQFVPHLTGLVKDKIRAGFKSAKADVSIVEVGGTVGDLENAYILESARQLQTELGRENAIFVHVTLLPYIAASKELKTKPTQHSVADLTGFGIQPDFLVLRADQYIPADLLEKISLQCHLPLSRVVPAPTAKSIYAVPLEFHRGGVGRELLKALGFRGRKFDVSAWEKLEENIAHSRKRLRIGMVGKYNGLEDAYYSLNEGLKAAGFARRAKVELEFVDAEKVEKEGASALSGLDGVCVPGGFGKRGIEGMVLAAKYARENGVPYLGVCLGSQIMAIEFARDVLGLAGANSTEFDAKAPHPVVHIMESQKFVKAKGGTMRLGAWPCVLKPGTAVRRAYGADKVSERHRHRYEFNNAYRADMEKAGFVVSGTSPDGQLAEMVEVKGHPFMAGTQAHPEFLSRPTRPHPLFLAFADAMLAGK